MPIAADPDWDDVEAIVADGDVPADAFPVLVGLIEPQPVSRSQGEDRRRSAPLDDKDSSPFCPSWFWLEDRWVQMPSHRSSGALSCDVPFD